MKKWGRIVFCTVLAVCLWFGSLRPASADYTYTVRIFAGNVGSFDGEEALVYTGLKAGDRINFYPSSVTINPGYEKYYVKSSLQEAGKENGRTYASFEVTCDRDYVVCYGIKGKTVAYTIHYQDAAGKELRDKEVFYGNIGDKPVEAYLYVEGYRPQYYNLTGTLSAKASDNEFYFVYDPVPETEKRTEARLTGTAQGEMPESAGETVSAQEDAETEPAGVTAAVPAGGNAQSRNEADGRKVAAAGDAGLPVPQEILDFDEVRGIAAPEPAQPVVSRGISPVVIWTAAGAAAVALLSLGLVLARRKTRR